MVRQTVLAVLLTVAAIALGCGGGVSPVGEGGGGGGTTGADTQPPTTLGRLTGPTQSGQLVELPYTGGTVRVEATVTDPSGVRLVELQVTPAPDGFAPRQLQPDAQGRVTATVTFPLNTLTSDQTYQVRLRVQDNAGNEGLVLIGTVVVRSPFAGIPPTPTPSL